MQAFLRFRVLIGCAAAAASALVPAALAAAPAMAGAEPPDVGCINHSSCFAEVNSVVSYSGSSGGDNGVVIPPPPCIGVPYGDAHTGSQAIISFYGPSPVPSPSPAPSPTASASGPVSPDATPPATTSPPPPPAPALTSAEQKILAKAEKLVNSNPIAPGEWYQIAGNPLAAPAVQQVCDSQPPYVWVQGGSPLPVVDGATIPVETVAALAYNELTTAPLGAVTLNPKGVSDTNLPTFVDVAVEQPRLGVLGTNVQGNPYVYATARTRYGNAATVWAWVTGMTIDSGAPAASATTWDSQDCTVAHPGPDGHGYELGSRDSAAQMAQVGAGAQIDCGVTYTAPGTFDLTVSTSWNACWTPGTAADADTAVWPPAGCRPVPGATGLQDSTTGQVAINVREIQSVNG